jgi:hypothetical protein
MNLALLLTLTGRAQMDIAQSTQLVFSRDEGVQKRGTTNRFLLVFCEDSKGDM